MPACPITGPNLHDVDAAVIAVLAKSPAEALASAAIVSATDNSMMNVLVSLARLTRAGQVERIGTASYRYRGSPSRRARHPRGAVRTG